MKSLKPDLLVLLPIIFLVFISLIILKTIEITTKTALDFDFSVQIYALILALLAGLVAYRYSGVIKRIDLTLYLLSFLLLIVVIFFGQSGGGAVRWLELGPFQLQPSELAKFSLLLIQAKLLTNRTTNLNKPWPIILSIIYTGLLVLLILLQPDIGTAVLIIGAWMVQLIVSPISKRTLILLMGIMLLAIPASYPFLADYQKDRIESFINPSINTQDEGYNVLQAEIAIGSGGLMGKGLDSGTQSQLNFLPSQHTDFVFAVIGEKLGLVGAMCVLIAFLVLLIRLTYVSWSKQSNFVRIFGMGVVALIGIQFVVNVGMNIGLAPVTGVPLPFVSSGGSHILVEAIMIGTLLGFGKDKK